MSAELSSISDSDLRALAAALRSGRLSPPFTAVAVRRFVSTHAADAVAREINALGLQGLSASHIAVTLELVLRDRSHRVVPEVDLVTTGPEDSASAIRDTAVVVRELFASANESVLVAGYAVYRGHKVFQALADRMQQCPDLRVDMYFDIRRRPGDTSGASVLAQYFVDHFRRYEWPVDRPLPSLYFDPRSLDLSLEKRACLHAKCVVVDRQRVFISSANFTEAAHDRNIEVGLLVRSEVIASQLTAHFNALLASGVLATAYAASNHPGTD
jgi:phosphatidylserine/phosphatidylglycerophosphate/cardiolipin synthase-like enzyme